MSLAVWPQQQAVFLFSHCHCCTFSCAIQTLAGLEGNIHYKASCSKWIVVNKKNSSVLNSSYFTRTRSVTSWPIWNNFHRNLLNFSFRLWLHQESACKESLCLCEDQRKLSENAVIWPAEPKMSKKKKVEKSLFCFVKPPGDQALLLLPLTLHWTELFPVQNIMDKSCTERSQGNNLMPVPCNTGSPSYHLNIARISGSKKNVSRQQLGALTCHFWFQQKCQITLQ